MKNTVLVFTSSIIITHIVLMLIFAINIQILYNFWNIFWSNGWELTIFGWICLITACATVVLTIYFVYKKNEFASYELGAVAGVFVGILLYMINQMAID